MIATHPAARILWSNLHSFRLTIQENRQWGERAHRFGQARAINVHHGHITGPMRPHQYRPGQMEMSSWLLQGRHRLGLL